MQKSLVVLIRYADLRCSCCHCRRWHVHKLLTNTDVMKKAVYKILTLIVGRIYPCRRLSSLLIRKRTISRRLFLSPFLLKLTHTLFAKSRRYFGRWCGLIWSRTALVIGSSCFDYPTENAKQIY